ncbi:hypothetical protein EV203_11920 [Caldanaerobacter subterraneus]|jgi:hypothetical protein|uniref:Uncharacterized protein n=1 Tax=Caldanaerobacter subterraneus TaxID=911092 RepID=A0A4R2JN04_9THEO|nr:hypothetical protein EV203_11920 [Caldanaerobacter subterraneus]
MANNILSVPSVDEEINNVKPILQKYYKLVTIIDSQ